MISQMYGFPAPDQTSLLQKEVRPLLFVFEYQPAVLWDDIAAQCSCILQKKD